MNSSVNKEPTNWKLGIIVVVTPSLLFFLLAFFSNRVFKEGVPDDVSDSDRQFVVTADALGIAIDAPRELFQKTHHSDGSERLTYRYPVEILPTDPMSVECLVIRTSDVTHAQQAFRDIESEVRRALQPQPDLLKLGDESTVGLLTKNGQAVGTFFAVRTGNRLIAFRMTGKVLEPEPLKALAVEKFGRLPQF